MRTRRPPTLVPPRIARIIVPMDSSPPSTGTVSPAALARVANAIARATRVTVLTGAGVSAASGVPTFRGPDGLWRAHRPEQLATPEAFARDPRLVWEWYEWRRQRIARCRPNRAHEVLAGWSRRLQGFTLVTQNVDGLHELAGTGHTVRFHGSIWELRCAVPCTRGRFPWRDETVPLPRLPPACPHCGGDARPAVVWFGEPIDEHVLEVSIAAAACDVFLVVGTSAVVYPAAALVPAAAAHGALTVEVNPEATAASSIVDVVLAEAADLVLPQVDALLNAG